MKPIRSILVLGYDLNHLGGGTCVAVWALQALVKRYEVSVLAWKQPDVRIANENFGTSLAPDDFRWLPMSAGLYGWMRKLPLSLALLDEHVRMRRARALVSGGDCDLVLGLSNEVDVGCRSIQYIHYPWGRWPRPAEDLRWYHVGAVVHAYRSLAVAVSGYEKERAAANVSLANSDWTAEMFAQTYGVRPLTVYPPVPGGFPDAPFEQRDRGFSIVGRISPEKRIEEAVRILSAVRARGHGDVTLQIIGSSGAAAYVRQIQELMAQHGDWISLHLDVSRDELVRRVTGSRYAIHAMAEEHFGIAPAELQRAGCITFVADGGGAPEIVDRDQRLIFQSTDDAVEKIDNVLNDDTLESSLRADVERRGDRYSEDRFMEEIVHTVESFSGA